MKLLEETVVGLCPDCSKKLNYHTKKREVKRLKRKHHTASKKKKRISTGEGSSKLDDGAESAAANKEIEEKQDENVDDSPWSNQKPVETKSREEEMEEYLDDLLL